MKRRRGDRRILYGGQTVWCGTLRCRRVGWEGLRNCPVLLGKSHGEIPLALCVERWPIPEGLKPLSRNLGEEGDATEHPQVWAGLKPGSNLCSPIPIFHTAQTPWEWMDWHKAPLLKCRCLKAPKISLTSSGFVGANKNCAMVWRTEVWVVHGHKCFYWTAAICPLFIKTQGWMLWSTEEDKSCEVSMEGSGYCKL